MFPSECEKARTEQSSSRPPPPADDECECASGESDLEIDLMSLESIEYTIEAAYRDHASPLVATLLPYIC